MEKNCHFSRQVERNAKTHIECMTTKTSLCCFSLFLSLSRQIFRNLIGNVFTPKSYKCVYIHISDSHNFKYHSFLQLFGDFFLFVIFVGVTDFVMLCVQRTYTKNHWQFMWMFICCYRCVCGFWQHKFSRQLLNDKNKQLKKTQQQKLHQKLEMRYDDSDDK